MNLIALIGVAILLVLVVVYFEKIKFFLTHLAHSAHSLADQYNSVYREDSEGEGEGDEDDKIDQKKSK